MNIKKLVFLGLVLSSFHINVIASERVKSSFSKDAGESVGDDIEKEQENCGVCLESLEESEQYTLSCNHEFHKECISKWAIQNRKKTCPICRGTIKDFEIRELGGIERSSGIRRSVAEQSGMRMPARLSGIQHPIDFLGIRGVRNRDDLRRREESHGRVFVESTDGVRHYIPSLNPSESPATVQTLINPERTHRVYTTPSGERELAFPGSPGISSLEDLQNIPNKDTITTINFIRGSLQARTLPANAFEGFTNLKEVLISGSKLTKIARNAFANLPHLTKIKLIGNFELSEIESGAFPGPFPHLEGVNLRLCTSLSEIRKAEVKDEIRAVSPPTVRIEF